SSIRTVCSVGSAPVAVSSNKDRRITMTQLPAHYLQQIWDQIRMGLMILNSDFTVRAWNQFLADRSPVFGNDLTGRPFLQAFPEANTAFWHDMVNRVQETGKQVFVQWRENPYLISLPAD